MYSKLDTLCRDGPALQVHDEQLVQFASMLGVSIEDTSSRRGTVITVRGFPLHASLFGGTMHELMLRR
jgi:hypothetical protein